MGPGLAEPKNYYPRRGFMGTGCPSTPRPKGLGLNSRSTSKLSEPVHKDNENDTSLAAMSLGVGNARHLENAQEECLLLRW